ncbi:MAG: glutathione S-transferase [Halioglobus sp.]|jgi:glutathione S-transferase
MRESELINDKIPILLKYLEGELPAEGFLFGDLGAANSAIASPFINAGYAGYSIDAQAWPITAAFAEQVKTHLVVAAVLNEEQKFVAAMQLLNQNALSYKL